MLVLIHTPALEILLLERTNHPGFWQSVTGSQEEGETLLDAAVREVAEETGIVASPLHFQDWRIQHDFEIFPEWRHRYAPGVTHNTEHVFSLEVQKSETITTCPDEHTRYCWLPCDDAARQCFSWTNREALLALPLRLKKT